MAYQQSDANERMARLIAERRRRRQEAADEGEQALQQAQYDQETDWGSDASQGAAQGAKYGPWGALIGGAIGTGVGQAGAYSARRDKGQGRLEAGARTLFDFKGLVNSLRNKPDLHAQNAGTMQQGMSAYQAAKADDKDGPGVTPKYGSRETRLSNMGSLERPQGDSRYMSQGQRDEMGGQAVQSGMGASSGSDYSLDAPPESYDQFRYMKRK